MIDCDEARELLALQPSSDDVGLREHLEGCILCAQERRQHRVLDMVLRAELQWEAPAELTARLMTLAASLSGMPAAVPLALRPRPKGWYVAIVYMLTAAAVGLSLAVAWQFMGLLATQIGLEAAVTQLLTAPAQGLAQLMPFLQALPASHYIIPVFLKMRDQLLWLLLIAVLWAALDKWNPHFSFRRPQLPS